MIVRESVSRFPACLTAVRRGAGDIGGMQCIAAIRDVRLCKRPGEYCHLATSIHGASIRCDYALWETHEALDGARRDDTKGINSHTG